MVVFYFLFAFGLTFEILYVFSFLLNMVFVFDDDKALHPMKIVKIKTKTEIKSFFEKNFRTLLFSFVAIGTNLLMWYCICSTCFLGVK